MGAVPGQQIRDDFFSGLGQQMREDNYNGPGQNREKNWLVRVRAGLIPGQNSYYYFSAGWAENAALQAGSGPKTPARADF